MMYNYEYPMHRAARGGVLENVKKLIELGVSVDSRDDWEYTPLHWAAEKGRYEVAELLISNKCDLNLKDRDGRTPVMRAAEMRDKFCVIGWGVEGPSPGHKDIVHLLLEHGAQVDCADDNECTLLHYASENDWTDVVRRILDRGEADINAATKDGVTPLMEAARWGRDDVAALLIRTGADVNQSYAWKQTALHLASFRGHSRVVQVLLEVEGLELNPQNEGGCTPLHYACCRGHREVIKQLLVAGADTTVKNHKGETALSDGITEKKLTLEEIGLFVQHGAYLQECDYVCISQNPDLKESVLKDVGVCTQSIVNKFHLQSLPALDSISYFARKLPNGNKFKLSPRQIDEVEKLVKGEIERKGFCNVVKTHPMALSALCVLSLITCQSGMKRSASPDFGHSNSPFKKLHT